MASTLATCFEAALSGFDPEFDVTAEPDLQDDLAADADGSGWSRGAIGNGRNVLKAFEGDDFEQQDARYESASRIALSLVR